MTASPPLFVLRDRLGWIALVLFLLVAMIAFCAALAFHLISGSSYYVAKAWFALAMLGPLTAFLLGWQLRGVPRLVVTADGILVRRNFGRVSIRWRDIVAIERASPSVGGKVGAILFKLQPGTLNPQASWWKSLLELFEDGGRNEVQLSMFVTGVSADDLSNKLRQLHGQYALNKPTKSAS